MPKTPELSKKLMDFFKLQAKQTTWKRELIGGFTTFSSMSYILVVHPQILADCGMDKQAMISVTALVAIFGALVMALAANYPIALAPGMGINAYFTYGVCLANNIPWQGALSFVFWNGVIFLILSLLGIRRKIVEAIPPAIKTGVSVGIGLLLAFIGLKNANVIIAHEQTFIALGKLNSPGALIFFSGVILSVFFLHIQFRAGILLSIIICAAFSFFTPLDWAGSEKIAQLPTSLFAKPASIEKLFLKVDIGYPFQNPQIFLKCLPFILSFLFIDLFGAIGTLIGVSKSAGLLDKSGRLPRIGGALIADSSATLVGSLLGTSSTTSYIESAAGVAAGARTGLASIGTAFCFLLAMFLWPVIIAVPQVASAPALLIVGVMMMRGVKDIDFEDWPLAITAFMTMICIPFTFSIADGIGIGFILYTVLAILCGRARKLSPIAVILAAAFLLKYIFL